MSRRIGRPPLASTLDRGLTVLEALERAPHPLTIQEIAEQSGIHRLSVYRLLNTLEARGYIERSRDKRYRAMASRRRLLIGYCGPLTGNAFRVDLAASIQRAAAAAGFNVMLLDNAIEDTAALLRNADTLIEARADLAMFFQPVEPLGHMLADRLLTAGIRFITIERPIQGGVYFGANNYQAGKMAGQALGRFATQRWHGEFDRVVLVEGAHTSTNVHARMAGVLVGLADHFGPVPESRVVHLHGNANREASRLAMFELLAQLPPRARLLVSGFNDISAVGAAEAVRESRREKSVAIIGQNAAREGLRELCRPESPFLASVAYFPERYGEKLMKIAAAIVAGEAVPPAAYTEHVVVDRQNIAQIYPEVLAESGILVV